MSARRASFVAALAVLAALPAWGAGAPDRFPAPPRQPCGGAGPNLVQNGGFESPIVTRADYRIVGAGGSVGAWRVGAGAVDFIACGFWQAAEGCQSVDLNSCEPAWVEQRLETWTGRRYALCFSVAGNPDGAPGRKQL